VRRLEEEGSKRIVDIARNENLPLQVIQLDVNDDKSVTDAFNRITKEKDRIDVVLNNFFTPLLQSLFVYTESDLE
jgi:NADP-dependent 3-hydroxy acid dehydrogenase YdfG